MIEIKYLSNGFECFTLCPYGKRTKFDLYRVGSHACVNSCNHFISRDTDTKTVTCNAQPNHETEEEIAK